jgi:hypothetical protein
VCLVDSKLPMAAPDAVMIAAVDLLISTGLPEHDQSLNA